MNLVSAIDAAAGMARRCALLAAGLAALAGCGERDGAVDDGGQAWLALDQPDHFLQFFNARESLPAGVYTLVVATADVGASGGFSGSARLADGTRIPLSGAWTASAGNDKTAAENPAFSIELEQPGGLRVSIESAADVCLYLLRDEDQLNPDPASRGGQEYAPGDGATCIDAIDLPDSSTASRQYASAYYALIDPDGDRATLAGWKTKNGFDQGYDGRLRFRDTRDLGYGRDLYFRTNDDGSFASYVNNFQVQTIPGEEYTQLNLDALVNNDRRYLISTSAIEYSCLDPAACDCRAAPEACFVKFYTFGPPLDGAQQRLLAQDLDGRGFKPMPGICVNCHGGSTPPLAADGSFPDGGDIDGKLQILEVDSFQFAARAGLTRADQEAGFKQLNLAVYCSYPGADAALCAGNATPSPPAPADDGDWHGELAVAQIEYCYGGDFSAARYGGDDGECDHVPPGWMPDPDDNLPPPGADLLYRRVVQPHCIVCHGVRGSNLGSDGAAGESQDVDFSSWARFIGYAEDIERQVFDEGSMPMALLNYRVFWSAPDKAALLGSLLPGFDRAAADGSIEPPGDPLANPGPDRSTVLPIRLDAGASLFADQFGWEVVSSPPGSVFSLDDAASPRPLFDADTDGEYRLRLTARNGARSDSAELVVVRDSSLAPAPGELRFDADVAPLLEANCGNSCHQAGGPGAVAGVRSLLNTGDRGADAFYRQVLALVDFADPAASPLLRKPAGRHHYGGVSSGFDPSAAGDRAAHDLLLNWILGGAQR